MFTYKVGTKCVHIVDDDDVKFYANEICKEKGTPHTIFIKKIEQCFAENPSSSKSFGIDLNVPLFPNDLNTQFNVYNNSQLPKKENFQPQNYLNPQYTMHYDAQLPKKEKCENDNDFIENDNYENDHYEHDWQMNTLKYIHKPPDPEPIIKTPRSQNDHGQCILKTGDKFDSKKECMRAIGRKALLDGYEFKPRKTDTVRYDVICVHPGCKWKIISSKCKYNSQWELGTVNDHHTCLKTTIGMYHRNASKNLLGHLLVPKFRDPNRIYKAKDIQNDINQEFNIDISYKQAWRSKNVALDTLEGCPKASFAQLPVFCHNLEMTNEGTVTHIDTDDEDHFKMVFIAFGVAVSIYILINI